MTHEPHDEFELLFSDDYSTEMVGSPGPHLPVGIHVRVNGTYLTGKSGDRYYVDDFINVFLEKLLRAVEEITDGEAVRVPLWEVPFEFRFQPTNEETVRVKFCCEDGTNYVGSLPNEGLLVTKDAVIPEILRTSREFLNAILEIDPELEQKNRVRTFEKALANAEATYERYESERRDSDEN